MHHNTSVCCTSTSFSYCFIVTKVTISLLTYKAVSVKLPLFKTPCYHNLNPVINSITNPPLSHPKKPKTSLAK